MADYTIAFSGLNSLLQSLPANTKETPYKLNVTGLTESNCSSSATSGTFGNIIKSNTKYIDLSETTLPSIINFNSAFSECTYLVVAPKIPETTLILQSTFNGCTSLVVAPAIPNKVNNLISAFSGCTSLTVAPSLPKGVTDMTFAFRNCTSLVTPPVLPSSVTTLVYTFGGCTSLKKAPDIPSSVTNMSNAFNGCSSLVEPPEIKTGVKNMNSSFWGCSSLKYPPAIPKTVTDLRNAFNRCTSLIEPPTIPSGVKEMDGTFYGCTLLTTAPVIPSGVTDLTATFRECTSIVTAPEIPATVTSLVSTFKNCTSLRNINLEIVNYSSSIERGETFRGCTNISSIYVPTEAAKTSMTTNASVMSISSTSVIKVRHSVAFSGLDSFLSGLSANSVSDPFSVEITGLTVSDLGSSDNEGTLGNIIKRYPSKYLNLIDTTLPSGLSDMTASFSNCSSIVFSPIIERGVTNINQIFENCSSLRIAPALENMISSIEGAFSGCSSIKITPVVYGGVTSFFETFKDCTSLKFSYRLPSVSTMNSAFLGCSSLECVLGVSGSANRLSSVFSGCSSLTSVTIDTLDYSKVQTKDQIFYGCNSLTDIFVINERSKSSAIQSFVPGTDVPSGLDLNTVIKVCTIEVPFGDLNQKLQNLISTTWDAPYKIKITGIDSTIVGPSSTSGTLGSVLTNHKTTYVDLSQTEIVFNITSMRSSFSGCKSLVKCFNIPDNVTDMYSTFYGCINLVSVPNLPSSLTDISYTFYNCSRLLTTPPIPEGVTNMDFTFFGCSVLTDAPVIPSGVTNMSGTFYGCHALTTALEIPSSVTNISNTFYACTSLTTVTSNITDYSNVTSKTGVFSYCSNLTDIFVPSEAAKTYLISNLTSGTDYPSSLDLNTVIKVLHTVPFSELNTYLQGLDANTAETPYKMNVTGLTTANGSCEPSYSSNSLGYILNQNPTKYVDLSYTELPSNLTNMQGVFSNCTSLVNIPNIPNGVTNMQSTFSGCTSLTDLSDLVIPNSVTNMMNTFSYCTSLANVSGLAIPDSVTIMHATFSDCTSLTDISDLVISNSITTMTSIFAGCTALTNVSGLVIPNSVTSMGTTFNGCTSLTDVSGLIIPNSVTSMYSTFIDCTSLVNVPNIPDSVTDMSSIFSGCTALTDLSDLVIPNSVTTMSYTFYNCTSLVNVPNIPDSVTNMIGTFYSCESLVNAYIDILDFTNTDVSNIFSNTPSLQNIYVLTDTAKNTLTIKLDDSSISNKIKVLHTVPFSELSACLESLEENTASNPHKLKITGLTSSDCGNSQTSGTLGYILKQNPTKYVDLSYTELPSGLTSLAWAFSGCTSLVFAPEIPNGVTNLRDTFDGCTSLIIAPEIPNSVTNMSCTFIYCPSLTTVPSISSNVTNLMDAFYNCSSLTSVPDIPNSATNLVETFKGCSSLTTAPAISNTATQITSIFSGCTSLTDISNVIIPASANYYSDHIFSGCTSLVDASELTISEGMTDLSNLFNGCSSLVNPPILPSSINYLSCTFQNCTSLTTTPTLPSGIQSLTSTFSGCTSLTTVLNIPSGVIGLYRTFQNCTSLTTVPEIPSGITTLYNTFSGCTSLTDITSNIADYTDVTTTGTFYNCTALDSVEVVNKTAKTTLVNKLTQPNDFPSSLDKDDIIQIKHDTIAFSDLNTYLQEAEVNTAQTPYILNITGLTNADLGSSSTSGTLGYILNQNSTKYVDLSYTELPIISNMCFTFSGCSTLVVSPELPSGVTNIGECFSGTSITTPPEIPSTVTNMYATFSGCSRMTSISNIPDGVTSLRGLFRSCTSLTDEALIGLEIPDSVLAIGSSADGPSYFTTYGMFRSDVQLVDMSWLEIPSSVLDAGEAFLGCVSLKYAPTIPDTITSLSKTFYNCTSLETVILEGEDFSSKNVEGIFHDCTSLKNVCVSSKAAKNSLIEELSSFDFPSSLDKNKVIKVGHPCTLDELDDYLKSLDPNTVSTPYKIIITDLASIDLGSSSSEGTLGYILNQNPTKYVDLSVNDLPNDLITLENSFKNCTTLIKVPTITEDIENLTNTFYGCSNLKIVTSNIEDYLDVSVDGAFYGCTNLKTIYVPSEEAKESLSDELTSSDFPSTLDKDRVIKYEMICSLEDLDDFLQSLDINSPSTPYQIVVTDLTAADLGSSDNAGTLGYVLKNNPDKYVDLTYTILPNNLTSLEESFKSCSNLVVPPIIPDTVTDMTNTFQNCTSLTDLYGFEIPDGVITLEGAFSGCDNLTNVYGFNIPDSVTNLSYAFEDCTSLIDPPNIPNSVTNMAYTFSGCTSLEEAPEIPNNVVIMNGTFKNCSSLTEVPEIPDGVINLSSTFEGCSSLINAPSISSEVVNLNKVFYNCSSLENIILEGEDFSRVNLTEAFCGCVSVEKIIVCSTDAKNSLINNLSSGDYPEIWELNDMIKIQTIETLEKEVASSVPITEMIIVDQNRTVNPKMGSSIVINGNSAILVTLGSSNIETCRVPVLSNNNDAYVLYYNALGQKVYDRIYSQYSVSYIYLGEIEVNNNTVSVWMPETGTSYRLNGDQTTQLYDGLPNDYKQYRGNGIYNYYYDTLTGSRVLYDLPDINLCVKISWGNAFTASVVAEQWYQDPAQSLDAGIVWTRSKWESGTHNWFPWVENNGDAAPATLTNKTIDGLNNILKISPTVISTTPASALVPTKKMIIVINTANVTLTVGNGPYVGYVLPIFATASCTVSYTGSSGSTSETLANKQRIDLIWNGSEWIYEKVILMEGTYRDNTTFAFNVVTRG